VFLAGMGALGLLTVAQGCSGRGGSSGGNSLAGIPPLAPPGPSLGAPSAVRTFGVSVTNGEYDPDIDLALLLATGAKIARMPFAWDRIEIGPKRYFWDYYDAIVPAMMAAGITPLLIAGVDNPVYGFGAARSTAQLQAAADFYGVAAARYRGAWWELGNEPDVAYFWPPGPDPAQYAAFVRAIAPAIRPYSSCIMSGGTSGINLGFISNYLALGVGNVVDCIAFHPYGVAPANMASALATLRSYTSKGLFCSEYGLNGTFDASPDLTAMANACGSQGVPFIWFELKDGPPNVLDANNTFGLYTMGRLPKPALAAAQAYAAGS
jgi:hypothetical protein